MARPSDREFALKRKIRDLEDKIKVLEIENTRLKKLTEKPLEYQSKKQKTISTKTHSCPDCGADLKDSTLPHGTLELCSKACGYRNVRRNT